MKILHIVNTYASAGGIETYVLDLLPLLKARGHENALVYRQQHPRTPPHKNQPIYHVPITDTPAYDRSCIADIIQKEAPTVLYLHDVYDPILISQVAQMVPTVGYVHIFYPICPGLGKLYRRSDKVCERAYGLSCIPMIYWQRCASARHPRSVYHIMQQTKQYLESYRTLPYVIIASKYMHNLMRRNGIEAKRVEILPYFIPIPDDSLIHALDSNCQDIMFAGRLEYEKGIPYLLDALRLIPTQHRLLIAGEGSLKQEYMRLAKDLGVTDRVEFLGWLSANELDTAYQRCAVTVMPTIMPEPFGKVGVEAMANNRPVVAFNVGGIPDWLKDGYNGFLVPPRDVKQLAAKINILLNDISLAAKLGTNGRKYVQEHYSTQRHVDHLLHVLDAAINQQNSYVC